MFEALSAELKDRDCWENTAADSNGIGGYFDFTTVYADPAHQGLQVYIGPAPEEALKQILNRNSSDVTGV